MTCNDCPLTNPLVLHDVCDPEMIKYKYRHARLHVLYLFFENGFHLLSVNSVSHFFPIAIDYFYDLSICHLMKLAAMVLQRIPSDNVHW